MWRNTLYQILLVPRSSPIFIQFFCHFYFCYFWLIYIHSGSRSSDPMWELTPKPPPPQMGVSVWGVKSHVFHPCILRKRFHYFSLLYTNWESMRSNPSHILHPSSPNGLPELLLPIFSFYIIIFFIHLY